MFEKVRHDLPPIRLVLESDGNPYNHVLYDEESGRIIEIADPVIDLATHKKGFTTVRVTLLAQIRLHTPHPLQESTNDNRQAPAADHDRSRSDSDAAQEAEIKEAETDGGEDLAAAEKPRYYTGGRFFPRPTPSTE